MTYFYWYGVRLFGFWDDGADFWRTLGVIVLLTVLFYKAISALVSRRLDKRLVIFYYILYFLLVVYVLFFKSVGVQGYNFDLIKYIADGFEIDFKGFLLNLLMFLPLGLLFRPRIKSIGLFLVFITSCEWLQWRFALGFFDLGDILLNVIGFFLGNLVSLYLIENKGFFSKEKPLFSKKNEKIS